MRQRLITFFRLILTYHQQIAVGRCDGTDGSGQPFAFKTGTDKNQAVSLLRDLILQTQLLA
ncbi:hypothetical protein D3C80_1685870 [compost metagenome]